MLVCAGHYPTYQSAVYGFASAGELRKLRKEAEQVGVSVHAKGKEASVIEPLAAAHGVIVFPSLAKLSPHHPHPTPPHSQPQPQKRGKPDLKVPGPKLPRQTGAAWDDRFNAWTFPFMGGWVGRAAGGIGGAFESLVHEQKPGSTCMHADEPCPSHSQPLPQAPMHR